MGVLGKQKKKKGKEYFKSNFYLCLCCSAQRAAPASPSGTSGLELKKNKPGKVKKVAEIPILCGNKTGENLRGIQSDLEPLTKVQKEPWGERRNRKSQQKTWREIPGGKSRSVFWYLCLSLGPCQHFPAALPSSPACQQRSSSGEGKFSQLQKDTKGEILSGYSSAGGFFKNNPPGNLNPPRLMGVFFFPYFWCLVANRICSFCCQYFTKKLSPTRVFLFPSLSGRFSWITGSSPKTRKNLFSAQKNQEKHPHSSLYPKK